MAGYIKLYRDIQTHWLWADKPFSKGQAWIDLLMMANHEEAKIIIKNEIITIERGCLITSEVKLAERWGWSRTKIREFLNLLKRDQMIDKKSDNKKTWIKILNYDIWQNSETAKIQQIEQQKNSKKTAEKHQKNTNNNNKNVKNDKNDKKNNNIFNPPTLEEVTSYCKERNNSVDPQRFIDFYESKGWMIGKNKMKDWKAAVRTWERRNDNTSKQDKPAQRPQNAANFTQRQYDDDFYERLKKAVFK